MEFINSETRMNLARSFAGESQARTRYTVYAGQAREEGLEWVARVFEETAGNEAVHAEEFLELLQKAGGLAENLNLDAGYPFLLGSTRENLAFAAHGEQEEYTSVYPAFAEIARREGFPEAARLWRRIATVENDHQQTFEELAKLMEEGKLLRRDENVRWKCLNCGFVYESVRAHDSCPVCGKGAGWQKGENKEKIVAKK